MEIKVVGVCGTPVKRQAAQGPTNTEILLRAVMDSASEQGDVQTDILWLAEDGFSQGCDQCNFCLTKQTDGKFCAKNDVMANQYYAKIIDCDAMVIATPVYIGRMSWLTAAFIDRLRALIEGKFYGRRATGKAVLKDKVLGVATVAWLKRGGTETAMLTTLYLTASRFDMIPTGFGPCGESRGEPEQRGNVKNDREAMLSAKNSGKRIVEIARIIKAGKEALAKKRA
jgi:multimeric flavodoxin WrbA